MLTVPLARTCAQLMAIALLLGAWYAVALIQHAATLPPLRHDFGALHLDGFRTTLPRCPPRRPCPPIARRLPQRAYELWATAEFAAPPVRLLQLRIE